MQKDADGQDTEVRVAMPPSGSMLCGVDHVSPLIGAGATDKVSWATAVAPALSVTVIEKALVPEVVGVPDINPVVPSRARPEGKTPEVTAHE